MRKKPEQNLQKRRFPVHFQTGKKFFSENGFQPLFGITNAHLCAKNYKNIMIKFRENPKKSLFSGYISGPGDWKKIFFSKIRLRHILGAKFPADL